MLVCPQCQFENPDIHKFCQQCGASLTEKTCCVCSASVPLDAKACPHCGAAVGTTWRAILLAPHAPHAAMAAAGDLRQNSLTADPQPLDLQPDPVQEAPEPPVEAYLDPQQRYQLIDPLPTSPDAAEDVEVRVLDRQPLQPSLLTILHRQQNDYPEWFKEGTESESTARPVSVAIPAIAQSYLTLAQQSPSLPYIHDAWQTADRTIVLLQDRTELPQLLDLWRDEQILLIQTLYWLYEMTDLWEILQPHHACQSLLQLNNLYVDEDHILCLQRLHFNDSTTPPSLQDLGGLWLGLFQKSQRTLLGSLISLCNEMEQGQLTDLSQLRSRLEEIAEEFQPDVVPTSASSTTATTAISTRLNDTMPDLEEDEVFENPFDATAHNLTGTENAADADAQQSERNLDLPREEEEWIGEGDDTPTVVLPMRLLSLEDSSRTDVGRQREHNEDYFYVQTEVKKSETPNGRLLKGKGLYILCDGMGGHASGEVASALAAETLKHYFATHWQETLPSEETIQDAILQANRAIYDLNQKNARSGSGRMGTTLVMVLIHDTEAAIAHVGDSRLYRFSRRLGLEQMTVDHEVGQREIQRGIEPETAYARPDAYQLTQALGPRDENFVKPDVQFLELNEDMLLLLCSDGLTDNDLLEEHWQSHVEPLLSSQINLEHGVNQLVDLANHYNGHDNITAIAIRAKVRPNMESLKR